MVAFFGVSCNFILTGSLFWFAFLATVTMLFWRVRTFFGDFRNFILRGYFFFNFFAYLICFQLSHFCIHYFLNLIKYFNVFFITESNFLLHKTFRVILTVSRCNFIMTRFTFFSDCCNFILWGSRFLAILVILFLEVIFFVYFFFHFPIFLYLLFFKPLKNFNLFLLTKEL